MGRLILLNSFVIVTRLRLFIPRLRDRQLVKLRVLIGDNWRIYLNNLNKIYVKKKLGIVSYVAAYFDYSTLR